MRIICSFLVLFILVLSSCKKYDDGPTISLMPRKDRITNKWRISSATTVGGKDTTAGFKNQTIEFTRPGSVILTTNNGGTQTKLNGTWQLNNSAKDLDISYDDGSQYSNEILKLKEKSLWYRDKSTQIEYHLEPF